MLGTKRTASSFGMMTAHNMDTTTGHFPTKNKVSSERLKIK